TVAEVVEKVRTSNQNTIAVVSDENQFLGIINRQQLRPFLLDQQPTEGVKIGQFITHPLFTVSDNDSVMDVAKMFDEADVWQLPLLDDNRKFKGFVSRSEILKNYRL